MNDRRREAGQILRAILICPDTALGEQLLATAKGLRGLDSVLQLDDYPSPAELSDRVRQSQCGAVLIDVGSSRQTALELIKNIADAWPNVSAVGLHRTNDPETILQSLRNGASEFLSSPFPEADVESAVQRMLKRHSVEIDPESASQGLVLAFTPVKGGSGATTLACNVAHQLGKASKEGILLMDLNLAAGIVSFLLRLSHPYNVMDALKHSKNLDDSLWGSLVAERSGLDVLLAPERPEPGAVDPEPLQQVLEYARSVYSYIVVDLGSVCTTPALATLPMAGIVHLVCGSDLPSLFMMRRTIGLIEELGYGRDQIRVIVNRMEKRGELSRGDMERIFRASVHSTFPADSSGVSRALRDGVPVADNSELGKSVSKYVSALLGETNAPSRSSGVKALKELFSGT